MTYQELNISFFENGDVYYHYQIYGFKHDKYQLLIEYPIENIILLDDFNVTPIEIAAKGNDICEIAINEYQEDLSIQFIKKNFLIKTNYDGKDFLKYYEKLNLELFKNSGSYVISIHSPNSYISALKKKSFIKWKNTIFTVHDLPLRVFESGVLEIDWELEILHEKKYLFGSNDPAFNYPKRIFGNYRKYDNYDYRWIKDLVENISQERIKQYLNHLFKSEIEKFLEGSCFYLSAYTDITPIVYLQDKIRVYIYCDELGICTDSQNVFKEIITELSLRLQKKGFRILASIPLDNSILQVQNVYFTSGYIQKLKNAEFIILENNHNYYVLLYLNCDNSQAFHSLYVKNKIVPRAICEIFPDGGSMGEFSIVKIPYKFRLPEFYIGHRSSMGKIDAYEMVGEINYFGIRDETGHSKISLYIRKNLHSH